MRNQYSFELRHESRLNTEFSDCQALSKSHSATGSLNVSPTVVRILIPVTAKLAVTSTDSAAKTKSKVEKSSTSVKQKYPFWWRKMNPDHAIEADLAALGDRLGVDIHLVTPEDD